MCMFVFRGDWDWDMVASVLWEVDHEEIMRILIGSMEGTDKLIWHYTSNGEYTVKSGYLLALGSGESDSQGIRCGFFKGLRIPWNLKIPNKIKIHAWSLLFNALPCRRNLLHREVKLDVSCPSCFSSLEDIPHGFWFCHNNRKIWKASTLWPILSKFQGTSFGDLFNWVAGFGHFEDFENFVILCWYIWRARNMLVFNAQKLSTDDVLACALNISLMFPI